MRDDAPKQPSVTIKKKRKDLAAGARAGKHDHDQNREKQSNEHEWTAPEKNSRLVTKVQIFQ